MTTKGLLKTAAGLIPLILASAPADDLSQNSFRLPGDRFKAGRSVARKDGDYYWHPNKGGAEIRRKSPKVRMSKKQRLRLRRERRLNPTTP